MLFERARWPANVRPEVAEAPCCGVLSRVTPGVITEKEMKSRPLIGRLLICCCVTTVATAVCARSTSGGDATTVTCCSIDASCIVNSSSTCVPNWRHAILRLRCEPEQLRHDPIHAGGEGRNRETAGRHR